ncbi:MAG: membrane integrity-associated transporter subunit PqiC [Mariprofundus sp.]|nr:membrane integrity-associated transporter subunit PqiC [Mariprofundus sp.]
MTKLYWRKIYYSLSLLLLLFVSSCSTPVSQYYVLNTIAMNASDSAHVQQNNALQISIRQLEIPRYLDRPRIVTRDADNHLRISEYHQWGGRLRDDLSRTLSDNLAQYLGSVGVRTAPFQGSMQADISLFIDIRQFELLADGRVHLKVRWHVQRRTEEMLSYFDHIIADTDVGERDFAAIAASMSHVLAEFSKRIALVVGAKEIR